MKNNLTHMGEIFEEWITDYMYAILERIIASFMY